MVLTHTPFVNTPVDSASHELGKHKAMVKYTDMITGEIIQALENAGIRDNTVVIWTTDNGTSGEIAGSMNGRKIKGGKAKTTEPGICAPFIVSWPGNIKSNRISYALIDFSDIFPTCLDLAGVEPKNELLIGDKSYKIDGYSFKEVLLKGTDYSHRKWILGMGGGNNARLTQNGVENQYFFRDRVLRNDQYKLYINTKREPEKYFDLLNDPFERNNLLDSLKTEERKNNFHQLYEVIKAFPINDNDPKYNPNPSQSWDVKISAESQLWKK